MIETEHCKNMQSVKLPCCPDEKTHTYTHTHTKCLPQSVCNVLVHLSLSDSARKWLSQWASKQMTTWKLKKREKKREKKTNSTHMTPTVTLLCLFLSAGCSVLLKNPAEVILNYCMLWSDQRFADILDWCWPHMKDRISASQCCLPLTWLGFLFC